jgi:hypothetical protein
MRAEAEAAVQAYRKTRRDKARARVERMRQILLAYNSGATMEEIGEALGMGKRAVRAFAERRGVALSRTGRRYRQVAFDPADEEALRAFAADLGASPGEAVQAIVKAALESDAHPARRLLQVRRRRLELTEMAAA